MPEYGEIPEHVAQYLARRVLNDLPQSVFETLVSLSPEELNAIERLGDSLYEGGLDAPGYVFVVH
jgi:hypothetical protein